MLLNIWSVSISLSQLKIFGLQNLMVTSLSTNPAYSAISVGLFVPRMVIQADWYHLLAGINVGVGSIPLYNDVGQFTCYADNVYIQAVVQFGRYASNTFISYLNLQYTADIQVYLSGSDGFVNNEAKFMISQMMRDREAISNMENLVKERANIYLRGHTPEEFIRIISNL